MTNDPAIERALTHARIDLQAAKVLAQHTLGEPHGINQTLAMIDRAMTVLTSPSPRDEVTEDMVTAAMRAFELMSSVLRYREKDKWHACDVMGMRDAIRAALAARLPC